MRKGLSLRIFSIAIALIVGLCNRAAAHHSAAEYEMDQPRILEGTVKTVNWTNPHITFIVESEAKDGEPARTWVFEAASPGVLTLWGWTKESLQPGDHAVFDYAPLRDGTPGRGYLLRATLPTGKELKFRFDSPQQAVDQEKSLDLARKLAAQDPGNAQAVRDVSESLERLGDMKFRSGDPAAALIAYQESLDMRRKLAAQDRDNAQTRRDLLGGLIKLGDAKLRGGARAEALAVYQESLDLARQLAAQDPGNVLRQTDLLSSLFRISKVTNPASARAALTEALSIADRLKKAGRLTAAQKDWPNVIQTALSNLP